MKKRLPSEFALQRSNSFPRFTFRYFCEFRCLLGPFSAGLHSVVFTTCQAIYFAAFTALAITLLCSDELPFIDDGHWRLLLILQMVCFYMQAGMLLTKFFCTDPNERPALPYGGPRQHKLWLMMSVYAIMAVFRVACSIIYLVNKPHKFTLGLVIGEVLSTFLFSSCILQCFNLTLPSKLMSYIDSTFVADPGTEYQEVPAGDECVFCKGKDGALRRSGRVTFHQECVNGTQLTKLAQVFGAVEGQKGGPMVCRRVKGGLETTRMRKNVDDDQQKETVVAVPYTCFMDASEFCWVDYAHGPDAIIRSPRNSEIIRTLDLQLPHQVLNSAFFQGVCCYVKAEKPDEVRVATKYATRKPLALNMYWREGEIVMGRWLVGVKLIEETANISVLDLTDIEAGVQTWQNVELNGKRFEDVRRPGEFLIEGHGYIGIKEVLASPEFNVTVV